MWQPYNNTDMSFLLMLYRGGPRNSRIMYNVCLSNARRAPVLLLGFKGGSFRVLGPLSRPYATPWIKHVSPSLQLVYICIADLVYKFHLFASAQETGAAAAETQYTHRK